MTFPEMTAKRWFWAAMAAGLVWCFAGWRWDGGQVSWMARVQNGLSQPAELAEVPPSFVLTTAQISAQNAVRSATGSGAPTASAEELQARVTALENENAQLKQLIMEYAARDQALGYLKMAHIAPEDVLPATVIGYGAGAGASILTLDRGTKDGVKEGAVVLAPLEQVHVLGRVINVGVATCDVRLISDPRMKTQGQIVRQVLLPAGSSQPAQNIPVTSEECLLEGQGNGTMNIEHVNKQDMDPAKGDLVCLTDAKWPAKVQHMVLGQVDAVSLRSDQPGRYDIRVVPRIVVSAQRTVMVLVRE